MLKGTGYPGSGENSGEVMSPLPDRKELRLLTDQGLARDPRTACQWQSFVNNQNRMASEFKAAMAKLAILGQDRSDLVDCSEALPPVIGGFVKQAAE